MSASSAQGRSSSLGGAASLSRGGSSGGVGGGSHAAPSSWRTPSRASLAYGAGSFAAAALHSIFIVYYVAVFLGTDIGAGGGGGGGEDGKTPENAASGGGESTASDGFHPVSAQWFFLGEAIFALWNAVNDPLFAWLLNRRSATTSSSSFGGTGGAGGGSATGALAWRRKWAIQVGGVLWATAFVLGFCVTPLAVAGWLGVDYAHEHGGAPADHVFPSSAAVFHEQAAAALNRSGVVGEPQPAALLDHTAKGLTDMTPPSWLVGLHFLASLVLYDGGLSLVMLAHGSILADLALSTAERSHCNAVNAIMGAAGSCAVFVAHSLWGMADGPRQSFRLFCLVMALFAAAIFWWSAEALWQLSSRLRAETARGGRQLQQGGAGTSDDDDEDSVSAGDTALLDVDVRQFAREVWENKNFRVFVSFNFLQVFNCHFNSNFLPLFLLYLVGSTLPPVVHSLVVTLSSFLPHAGVAYAARWVPKDGLWVVVSRFVVAKQAMAVIFALLLFLLTDFWSANGDMSFVPACAIAIYLTLNKTNSEMICRHGGLVLADVTDEFAVTVFSKDVEANREQRSWSAAVLGANAFLTKPAASLAPVLGWLLLQSESDGWRGQFSLKAAVFLVPLVVGAVQTWLWSSYSLRGERLNELRRWRKTMEEELSQKR